MKEWFNPLREAISKVQRDINKHKSSDPLWKVNEYGPGFVLLEDQTLSLLAIQTALNMTLSEQQGCTLIKMALQLGKVIQEG